MGFGANYPWNTQRNVWATPGLTFPQSFPQRVDPMGLKSQTFFRSWLTPIEWDATSK